MCADVKRCIHRVLFHRNSPLRWWDCLPNKHVVHNRCNTSSWSLLYFYLTSHSPSMRRHNNFNGIQHKSSETHESKQALKDGEVDSEAWTCTWSSVLRSTAGTKTTLSHHIKAFFLVKVQGNAAVFQETFRYEGKKKTAKGQLPSLLIRLSTFAVAFAAGGVYIVLL